MINSRTINDMDGRRVTPDHPVMSQGHTSSCCPSIAGCSDWTDALNDERRAKPEFGLDISNIEQMCKSLPHDCYVNAATGASLRGEHSDGSVTYLHAYCKKLTCRTCARKICNTLIDSLADQIVDHKLLYFVTLTLPGDVRPENQEIRLKQSLRKLMRSAKRAFGALSYVWVISSHSRGSLHLHVLTSVDLRKGMDNGKRIPWLKTKWHKLTGAQQVSCVPSLPADALNRAIYMVKNIMEGVLRRPELGRRRGCTRNIKLMAQMELDNEGTEWSFVDRPTSLIAVEKGVAPHFALFNGPVNIPPKSKTVGAQRQSVTATPSSRREGGTAGDG